MPPQRTAPAQVRVRLTDRIRLESEGGVVEGSDLGSRRGRQVLAVLAVNRGRAVSAERLAEVLWPDDRPNRPERVVASLVSRLRAVGGPGLVVGDRFGYALGEQPDVVVDLDLAGALVTEAAHRLDHGEPGLALVTAKEAVAHLGSAVLTEEPDASWAGPAREEHRVMLGRARHIAAAASIRLREPDRAAALARSALTDDPFDEEALRLLMTAQAAAGAPSAALAAYDRHRHRLVDALGVEPAAETQALHLRLLRGEPLDARDGDDGGRGARPGRRTGRTVVLRPSDQLPLTGRRTEQQMLRSWWESAAAGTGRIVVVAGPPGVGKTRLAEDVVDLAERTGGLVMAARCFEAERSLFLQPVADAASTVLAERSPGLVRRAVLGHEAVLSTLLPDLAAVIGAAEPAGAPAAATVAPPTARLASEHSSAAPSVELEQRATFEALAAFLAALSRHEPVLLFLDDLHHAGRSTHELVHYLRREAARSRLLVLAAVRTVEGEGLLRQLAPVSDRLDLGDLGAGDVAALAAAAGQGDRADEIARRTGGHPLFVVEVLRDLSTGGSGLPDSLQESVLARIGALDQTTRSVLRAAAVLGGSFDPVQAGHVAGVPAGDALAGCELALAARLLDATATQYTFANDLVRDAVYASIPGPTRVSYHRQAADLLVDQPEAVAAHAAAAGERLRAGRSWLLAAEQALRRFAAADAEDLAAAAVEIAETAGDDELLGRALVVRGRARDAMTAYRAAWADYQRAVEVAHLLGDQRLEMTALREVAGDVSVALGRPPADCAPPLLRLIALAESLGDRVREADALSRLTVLAGSRLQFVDAARFAERAGHAAAASADPTARMFALDALKSSLAYLGEVDRLAPVTEELTAVLRRAGDLWTLQWVVFESAFVPLAAERYDQARQRMTEALEINRHSGYVVQECWFLAHLAWLARLSGDLDTSLRVGQAAVQHGQEHGAHRWWWPTAAAVHAGSLLVAGRSAEAATLLTQLRPAGAPGGDEAYRLRLLAPLAEATGAHAVLLEADALLRGVVAPPGAAWLAGADTYLSVARTWLRLGDPDRAAAVLNPFLAAARRNGWSALVRLADEVVAQATATPLQQG